MDKVKSIKEKIIRLIDEDPKRAKMAAKLALYDYSDHVIAAVAQMDEIDRWPSIGRYMISENIQNWQLLVGEMMKHNMEHEKQKRMKQGLK